MTGPLNHRQDANNESLRPPPTTLITPNLRERARQLQCRLIGIPTGRFDASSTRWYTDIRALSPNDPLSGSLSACLSACDVRECCVLFLRPDSSGGNCLCHQALNCKLDCGANRIIWYFSPVTPSDENNKKRGGGAQCTGSS